MAEVQCLKVRIQPGQTEHLLAFLRSLQERHSEVQDSLRAEGILLETLFIERAASHDTLFFYSRASNLAAASAAFAASSLPLDIETRQIIAQTWAEAQALELIIDLEQAS